MIKLDALALKENRAILKIIVEMLFTFGDIDKKYEGLDANMGNIQCPFHPVEGLGKNEKSPAAKIYYNEEKNINVIHCFNSHKTYSVYDYVEKILLKDPYAYLIENKDINDISPLYESILKGHIEVNNNMMQKKIQYVDNLLECNCDTSEYIENLYTGGQDV